MVQNCERLRNRDRVLACGRSTNEVEDMEDNINFSSDHHTAVKMAGIDSRLRDYLATNDALTDEDVSEVQRAILERSSGVAELDETIAQLKQALEDVQSQRDAISDDISKYRTLLSPIRKLPVDILQTIFLQCLPSSHNALLSYRHAPLLLTHVCRQWRDLALGAPGLWASIHIPIPTPPSAPAIMGEMVPGEGNGTFVLLNSILGRAEATSLAHETRNESQKQRTQERAQAVELRHWQLHFDHRLKLVECWLERAGSRGLSISLAIPHQRFDFINLPVFNQPAPPTNPVDPLIQLILTKAAQVEKLEVSVPSDVFSTILSLPGNEAPRLRDFRILHGGFQDLGTEFDGNDAGARYPLLSTPSLRKIYFSSISLKLADLPLTWDHLTELHFVPQGPTRVFDVDTAVAVLQRTPHLERCTLAFRQLDRGSASRLTDEGSVDLPKLRHLFLYSSNDVEDSLKSALQRFITPNLTSLAFATTSTPSIHIWGDSQLEGCAIVPLLVLWGHNIKEMQLESRNMTSGDIRRCLGLTPNLHHLSLTLGLLHPIPPIYNRPLSGRDGSIDARRARLGFGAVGLLGHSSSLLVDALLGEMTPAYADNDPGSTRPISLPHLRSFAISVPDTAQLSRHALLRFIKARRHENSKARGTDFIQHVKVQFNTVPQKFARLSGWEDSIGFDEFEDDDFSDDGEDRLVHTRSSCAGQFTPFRPWKWVEKLKNDVDVDLEGLTVEVSRPRQARSPWSVNLGRGLLDDRCVASHTEVVSAWDPRAGLEVDGWDNV